MHNYFHTEEKVYSLITTPLVCNKFGLAEFFVKHFAELSLPHPQHVLDVGCGAGPMGIYFADQYQSKVLGVDLNPIACQCCQKNIDHFNLSDKMQIREQDFCAFASAPFDFIPDLIVANPPVNDRIIPTTFNQYRNFNYSTIDWKNFSFLTNSWHNENGQDLTDIIFEYALRLSNPALHIALVFCLIDCESPDFILNKAHRMGLIVKKTICGTISPSSIGVENFTEHPIYTYLISFKVG